jgi:hypothetical protein
VANGIISVAKWATFAAAEPSKISASDSSRCSQRKVPTVVPRACGRVPVLVPNDSPLVGTICIDLQRKPRLQVAIKPAARLPQRFDALRVTSTTSDATPIEKGTYGEA